MLNVGNSHYSSTFDAQGAAACVNAMHVMGDLSASPSAIKQVLSSAAVDLNHVL
jgi:hypothetical protein